MVGITLEYNRNNFFNFSYEENYNDNLSMINVNSDKNHFIRFSYHDGYPFNQFENNLYKIFIEGKIYSESNSTLEGNLYSIAEKIFNNKEVASLAKWIKIIDGDYIGYIYHKETGEFILFNDLLGRLPLYYSIDSHNKIIISRSLNYIVKYLGSPIFDQLSLAQFLLFGYNLSSKTIFTKIQRFKPSSIIHINPKLDIKFFNNINTINFEEKLELRGNVKKHIQKLTDYSIIGCKNRVEKNKVNLLSLSGGVRLAIAGALFKSDTRFETVNFKRPMESKFRRRELGS